MLNIVESLCKLNYMNQTVHVIHIHTAGPSTPGCPLSPGKPLWPFSPRIPLIPGGPRFPG